MERESRLQFGCALLTCLTIPMMLCIAALGFWGFSQLSIPQVSVNAPRGGQTSGAAVDRIVLIGDDGNIYLIDRQGENKVALTNDAVLTRGSQARRAYLFPSWSPDSQNVAFVSITDEQGGKSYLYTTTTQENKPREIFSSDEAVPFYLAWSPNNQGIAFLIENDTSLSLKYASADGSGTKELSSGNPLYFSWAPNSQNVISHVGGSRRQSTQANISMLSLDGGATQKLPIAPANFLAPAWSPNGESIAMALMGSSTTGDSLIATDARGENMRTLAKISGEVAFAWSPDGKYLAYLAIQQRTQGEVTKSELRLISADGSNDQLLSSDTPVAFFWSPDNQKLAYLTSRRGDQGALQFVGNPALQQQRARLTWKVIALADKAVTSLASFTPSDRFASLLPYFDQYAQSLQVWSPDSRALVYSAQGATDAPGIYVTELNRGEEARRIAAGSMAVWSWK